MAGGRYEIKDGKRVRVEAPTRDHPDGNAPRDAKGNRLDRPVEAPSESAPKPAEPRKPKE